MFIRFRHSPNYSSTNPVQVSLAAVPSELHRFWWLSGWLGVGLISATLGGLVALISHSTPLQQKTLSPNEAAVFSQAPRNTLQLDRPLTLMVIGTSVLTSDVDAPPPSGLTYHANVNSLEGLSDTLLLVRVDPQERRLVMLSIPRDTLTSISGRGDAKINEANALGGPALTAETVSQLLGGVQIDRYLRINVQGVTKLVDALGGVTFYVPKDMKYRDDSQRLNIDLKAGKQHLNGQQTHDLLRFRYDELGDIGRIQRQQAVIRAVVEQSLQPETLARIPQILTVVQENLDTNLSLQEVGQLTGFISNLPRSQMQMLMLPGYFSNNGQDSTNPSYWLPRYGDIQALVNSHFRDHQDETLPQTQPSRVRIAIQPSGSLSKQDSPPQPASTNPTLSQTIKKLGQAGYSNVYFGQAWGEPLPITRIIAQQGDLATAQAIRIALGFGEVRVESTGVLDSDITIQLGTDAQSRPSPNYP
ncbi:LCP family protein [Thermosynechococcaceae cyanobacterium BACA0444]|uniref:LCP family protein n=1 Tax=Pseudocalidococcus azoricus BACA0444 TaxID=2918990 RepID=A0AAE4FT51_9CYAN|nr:LCP family protein [Pseudocalidococcus azoricus]MDS3861828.1 LCP family protein [Pseudocalidococcus azoricus BACA0444]